MKNIFKKISASLIIVVVLCSVLGLFGSASAQERKPFRFNFQVNLNVEPKAQDFAKYVAPVTEQRPLDVNLDWTITGLVPSVLKWVSSARQLVIRINVDNNILPDWVTVSVPQSTIYRAISLEDKANFTLIIKFTEDAPATQMFNVPLNVTIEDVDFFGVFINGVSVEQNIPITPNFLPNFNVNIMKPYVKISPGSIAVFPVEIENTANGMTEFTLDVEGLPEGWTASVQSVIQIPASSTGNNKRTVSLQISPPTTFGFFNEKINFNLDVEGKFFVSGAGIDLVPKNNSYLFTVEIQGFSFIGFEIPLLVIILVIVGIIIFFLKKGKK
jgi:hypothetical protein